MKPRYRFIDGAWVPVGMNAISKAIQIVGLAQLAKDCDVTYQAVRKWERGRVPAERCRDIIKAVDQCQPGAITLHALRPDLWPLPASQPRQAA